MCLDHTQLIHALEGLPLKGDALVQPSFQVLVGQEVIVVVQVQGQAEATQYPVVLEQVAGAHARKAAQPGIQ